MRDDLSLAMNNTAIQDDGDQQAPRRRAQAALVKLRARIARRPGRWRRRMRPRRARRDTLEEPERQAA